MDDVCDNNFSEQEVRAAMRKKYEDTAAALQQQYTCKLTNIRRMCPTPGVCLSRGECCGDPSNPADIAASLCVDQGKPMDEGAVNEAREFCRQEVLVPVESVQGEQPKEMAKVISISAKGKPAAVHLYDSYPGETKEQSIARALENVDGFRRYVESGAPRSFYIISIEDDDLVKLWHSNLRPITDLRAVGMLEYAKHQILSED